MADRDTLLSTLPDEVRDDAARLHDAASDPDPRDIVAELHRLGLIRDDQLRDSLLSLEDALRSVRMRPQPPANPHPTILGPLGAGAMGEVLLAKDDGLNRVVAMKRMLPALAGRPAVVERFYREAQVTAQLDHPSIVPIHSLVWEGGTLAYTMKLVRGRTLEKWLEEAAEHWRKHARDGREHHLSARLQAFLKVCEAVAYANDRGVVHRDLKPENVMVGTFGQVLVMDWGIARVRDVADAAEPESGDAPVSAKAHGTKVGSVFGTPRYMSPEQATGRTDLIDGRSDQYALGLILCEVVTLRPAIPEELDLTACIAWAASARRRPMAHLHRKGNVPRELVAIVDKACSKEPARRYASVEQLAEDVRRYLRDEAVVARPDTLGQRVHRWVGHHRTTVLMLLSFLVTAIVALTFTLLLASLGVVEWRRQVAAAHEAAVTEVIAVATGGAAAVSAEIVSAESALVGLTYGAEAGLVRPDRDQPDLPYDPLVDEPVRPRASPIYGRSVSGERPSFAGPSRSDKVQLDADRLTAVTFALMRPLLDSAGAQGLGAKQRASLIAEGAPIRWARVATTEGVLATAPGTVGFREGVDGRKAPWYRKDKGGVRWTGPAIDPDDTGLVLTATHPLFDQRGDLVGTAAVVLTVDALVARLKPHPLAQQTLLVSPEGEVVAWPDLDAPKADAWAPRALPVAGLEAALKQRPDGFLEVGDTAAAWAHVHGLGWRYLVLFDHDDLGDVHPAPPPAPPAGSSAPWQR